MMRVISLAGSPRQPSRSSALLALSHRWLTSRGVEVISYSLQDFSAEDLLFANFASPQLKKLTAQLAEADGLIVATPVYKASFSGALKTLLDLLPERALDHKVVLPLATAGSIGHMLAVDYALKPVLASLKAQEVLQGVFADDSLISDYHTFPATLEAALSERLEESLENFYLALSRRRPLPRPTVQATAATLRV
ncbi:NAD(P)H-dependent FMN reductase [Enterobacterales bacterium]|nr:NAD(P)H-dependent FMN reductase [Enterobacterales bacterium]